MKPLFPPHLFSSHRKPKSKTADPTPACGAPKATAAPARQRFEPPESTEVEGPGARASIAAQIIAQRFLSDIRAEWAQKERRVEDLWQPPGE
jgi:hypothetical protein